MPTIDAAIPAGADDVALDDNGFDAANGYPVLGRAGATDCIYAFRVPVSGLQGATITAAWIDNVNQANGGSASPLLAIYAEDAASPARITSLTDLNGRTRTTAKVDWDVAWTGYNTKDSPSIVSIIQELADSYNPDYIQIFIQNDGGTAGVQVYAYEGGYPPTLHIEYTSGGGTNVTITAAAVGFEAGIVAAAVSAIRNVSIDAGAPELMLGVEAAAVATTSNVSIIAAGVGIDFGAAPAEVVASQNVTITGAGCELALGVAAAGVSTTWNVNVAAPAVGFEVAVAGAGVAAIRNVTVAAAALGMELGIVAAIVTIAEPIIPEARILHIRADNRALRMHEDWRALSIEEETRVLRVRHRDQTLTIRPESRVMRIEK